VNTNIIHVTDHAFYRWKHRVSDDNYLNVYKIIDVVKKAKLVSKKEIIPFTIPRQKNSIYAIYEDILFVMKPIAIDEYSLVTIITQTANNCCKIVKNQKKIKVRFVPETKKKKKKIPARKKTINLIDDY
jgi:hypothetical protein